MRIVIPGGSGQVGRMLERHFGGGGHSVRILRRGTDGWDGERLGAWVQELDGADVLINLAGRSVNCRYHERNRREIIESRVKSTAVLGEALRKVSRPPRVWLNASTATIYRHALDRDMDEATGELGGGESGAPDTWRFSIEVAKAWEKTFFDAALPGVRQVALRSAMTMSPDRGGVFDVLLGLVRKGLGGTSGPGTQYVSWIHEADFARAIDFLLLREEMDGVVNLSSPHPLPNHEFMQLLREAWGAPIGLPAAAWMLEVGAVFLRTETELVLKSRRVVPGRLLAAGFVFEFPQWREAANDLVARWRKMSMK